jgi:para-nitrobenzyl esterase
MPDQYAHWLHERYGDDWSRVQECYPGRTTSEVRHSLERIRGDGVFLVNARAMARRHSGLAPTFQYRFTRRPDTPQGQKFGAHHSADVPYVFGTGAAEDPGGKRLSETMMDYWVRFAETGDPNQAGLPAWPAFDPIEDQYLELGDDVQVRTEALKTELDLFEKHSMRPDRAR